MAKEIGPKERELRALREARLEAARKAAKPAPKPTSDGTSASPKKPLRKKTDG